jgi:hypothetical protein
MAKFIPLLLLVTMVTSVLLVAAPKAIVKEGLVSHEATGKAYVVRSLPYNNGEGFITAGLKVRYVVAGLPGDTYTVELWLGLPEARLESDRARAHFDTQEVTVPGEDGKLTEIKGIFDRCYQDRPPDCVSGFPPPPWFKLKPGTYSLVGPGKLGAAWDCRLVVKKQGKVLTDTGYFRVILPPVVDL